MKSKIITKETKSFTLLLSMDEYRINNIAVLPLHGSKKLPGDLMNQLNSYIKNNRNIIYNEKILNKLLEKYIKDNDI